MSRLKIKPSLSVADYLAGEREADVRHEYVDGRVYALGARATGTTASPETFFRV